MKQAPVIPAGAVEVMMHPPVIVDQSPPELSKEWGRWRMPKVYRMPTGELCLTFSISADHYADQGRVSPMFLSRDEGETWARSQWPDPALTGMGPVITPIQGGEFYTIPATAGIELDPKRMPKPAGTMNICAGMSVYPLDQCPDDVVRWFKDIKAVRWSPVSRAWTPEQTRWDHRDQFIFSYHDTPQKIAGHFGQKIYLESPIVSIGRELLHADYWTIYASKPGQVPTRWECSLMASADNGRSWTRRSTIAAAGGTANLAEPVIEKNQAGDLVCAIRVDDSRQPALMLLVHSTDQGHTWSEPRTLLSYGVFPRLLQLDNGVMVLSYGRSPTGTMISFSPDGGRSWTEPRVILPWDGDKGMSCGYTSLYPISSDTFLIAYGDRHLPNASGDPCKSILVRRISVRG